MGSYFNFNPKNSEEAERSHMKSVGNFPLARQSSVYSLTIDEFQNSLGGFGKDLGSMNMDELLRNIWTAEETQAMTSSRDAGDGYDLRGNLQRQGSLTLPRTLSQKTVDEVWRNLFIENGGVKDGDGIEGSRLQQRQQTLGEITLEEFLVRAGVVREDTHPVPNITGFHNEPSQQRNNITGSNLGHSDLNHGTLTNQVARGNIVVPIQPSNLPLNVSGVRSSQQNLQPLFPKQATVVFATTQLVSPRSRETITNNPLVQDGVIQSGEAAAAESTGSQLSSDGMSKSNTSSVSPPSNIFSGGARGRRSGGSLEKAMERRHRRMIKNRESAARSRARKQVIH